MEAREEMSPDGGKAMSWEDAKSLISDVQELFACTDVCPRKTHDDVFLPPLADDVFPPLLPTNFKDLGTIEDILRVQQEIKQALLSREHDARTIIRGEWGKGIHSYGDSYFSS